MVCTLPTRSRSGLAALTPWLAALALLACAAPPASPPAPPFPSVGDHELSLEHGGRERFALVRLPPGFADAGPLPVVLSFHGGGGNARAHKAWTGLDAVADREGFVAVYPDGSGPLGRRLETWNAGTCCGYALDHQIDDVGFVYALLERLSHDLDIDPTRVYATGMSNGAMMSYRLAVDTPERIAAIAPVAGAMVYEGRMFFAFDGSPGTGPAMPVIHFHSKDDGRALYDGGLGPAFPMTNRRVEHPALEGQLRKWIRYNACPEEGRVVEERVVEEAGRADQGHTATRIEHAPCREGSAVVLWQLTGAGHVWPGPETSRRERLLGPSTTVVDASEEIWRFFERFRRPDAPAFPKRAPSSPERRANEEEDDDAAPATGSP